MLAPQRAPRLYPPEMFSHFTTGEPSIGQLGGHLVFHCFFKKLARGRLKHETFVKWTCLMVTLHLQPNTPCGHPYLYSLLINIPPPQNPTNARTPARTPPVPPRNVLTFYNWRTEYRTASTQHNLWPSLSLFLINKHPSPPKSN